MRQRITLKEVCCHPWVASKPAAPTPSPSNSPVPALPGSPVSPNAAPATATSATPAAPPSPAVSRPPSAGGDTCAPLGRSLRVPAAGDGQQLLLPAAPDEGGEEGGDCQADAGTDVRGDFVSVDEGRSDKEAVSVAGDNDGAAWTGRDLDPTSDFVDAGYRLPPNL